jgi:hypothetical protein
MQTTAGAMALLGFVPSSDAFQVRKLREAGAVIIGKSNLHELASGITTVGSAFGQTRNPYDPSRNPGGSSGGTAAAIANAATSGACAFLPKDGHFADILSTIRTALAQRGGSMPNFVVTVTCARRDLRKVPRMPSASPYP